MPHRSRILIHVATALTLGCSGWTVAGEIPQHIANLTRNHFFSATAVASPITTITAGTRFQSLTTESQHELCEIALGYYRGTDQGITRIQLIDDSGHVLLSCGG